MRRGRRTLSQQVYSTLVSHTIQQTMMGLTAGQTSLLSFAIASETGCCTVAEVSFLGGSSTAARNFTRKHRTRPDITENIHDAGSRPGDGVSRGHRQIGRHPAQAAHDGARDGIGHGGFDHHETRIAGQEGDAAGRVCLTASAPAYFTVATRNALVVPASPNGTPAVTTISSPGAAKPSVNAARAARLTASPIE